VTGAGGRRPTRAAASLPPLLVLTDETLTAGRPLLEVLARAIVGGARAVLLREKHRPRAERRELAAAVADLLRPVDGILLVASDPAIPAAGLHLAAADPLPEPAPALLGRSCHSRGEVRAAAAEGCRYVTLSPVFATASKPGYGPALGPAALGGHPLPVWALGGVDAGNAGACLRAGAAGVAVMGAVMRARDPAAEVSRLNAAVAAAGAVP
jgi:thiamine-phosphate diphosphorylase